MAQLVLTFAPADGVQLDGTSRSDGTADVLRGLRDVRQQWKWSRDLGTWFQLHTRDREYPRVATGIRLAAERLRAAGHDVDVQISEERRTVAEQEQDRADRAASRTDRLEARAARLEAAGEARIAAADARVAGIPFGQPILVGHHSERRHRRDLERWEQGTRAGLAQLAESEDAAHRAQAAASNQRHREHGGTTERRIAGLEADLRRAQRNRRDDLVADLEERIAHWRKHLDELVAAGEWRVWTPADFERGDYVLRRGQWLEVKRVNRKSLTVPHILAELAVHGHTWPATYDEIDARRRGGIETRRVSMLTTSEGTP